MDDDRLSLVLANQLAEVPRTAAKVESFCGARGIPDRIVNRFNLGLEEVLTNVINYAFRDGLKHEIDVAIEFRNGKLKATVVDDGDPFDPLAQPAPDIDAPLETRRIGGLGIHLLRSMMDAVEYQRIDGRNRLTFGIHIEGPVA